MPIRQKTKKENAMKLPRRFSYLILRREDYELYRDQQIMEEKKKEVKTDEATSNRSNNCNTSSNDSVPGNR